MPRRKPISNKQRKEQLQHKRAVKRGDAPIESSAPITKSNRRRGPPTQRDSASVQSVKKLQSYFVKLPPQFLENTKFLASTLVLQRPIHPTAVVFPEHWLDLSKGDIASEEPLICPKRPKWRYDMSKEEVEKNEEGLFKKWLAQTDETVNQRYTAEAQQEASPAERDQHDQDAIPKPKMPHAPTSFERNLEVWRQLYVSLARQQ